MKSVLAIIVLFFSQASLAYEQPVNHVVPAEIKVSYYRNLMPIIDPHPNYDSRVFFVEVGVEFCTDVTPEDFNLVSFTLPAGNLLQLYTANGPIRDCRGVARKQWLSLPLPLNADKDQPFFSAEQINLIHLGDVH